MVDPPNCCRPHYAVFDDRIVKQELALYRRNGPDAQTRELIEVLVREGIEGAGVVDIGAGLGAIGHGLVASGAASVTDVDGSPAYKVVVREKNGDTRTLYLDEDAFLEIKMDVKRVIRGADREYEVTIGDYKNDSGVMLPYSIESKPKGAPQGQKVTFDIMESNPKVDDSFFAEPAISAAPAPTTEPEPPGKAAPKSTSKKKPPVE